MNELSQMCRWTLSWKPACCRFLEKGSLIEIFWQLWLQWKKILAQNCQSPLPQTMNNFLTLLFFHVRQLFRGRMPYSYIKKQLRRNILHLQSFDAFAVLMDYDGSKKVTKIFLPYSIILWAQWTNSILSQSLSIVGILLTLILYSCLT